MAAFDETQHDRDSAGKFTEMAGNEQDDALTTLTRADSLAEADQLELEIRALRKTRVPDSDDRIVDLGAFVVLRPLEHPHEPTRRDHRGPLLALRLIPHRPDPHPVDSGRDQSSRVAKVSDMTSQPCPTWCMIHDDPAWIGPHHSEPIDIAAVIEHDGIPTPTALVLTRIASDSGEWIQVQAEETALLDLRLDLSTATRLTYAIDLATTYAVHRR